MRTKQTKNIVTPAIECLVSDDLRVVRKKLIMNGDFPFLLICESDRYSLKVTSHPNRPINSLIEFL